MSAEKVTRINQRVYNDLYLLASRTGTVLFQGKDVTRLKVHTKARLGIGYVPEDRQIFPDLTVRENLDIGRSSGIHRKDGWNIDRIYGLFPVLERYDRKPGGQLSGGEQQMLTIARTLMGNPELVLLDGSRISRRPSHSRAAPSIRMAIQNIQSMVVSGIHPIPRTGTPPFERLRSPPAGTGRPRSSAAATARARPLCGCHP